ncbi:MAG TPA: creatininase family protein [Anaerolineaceae bacterium]
MQWEQLTSPDFAAAVQSTGVCLVAFGVLERHADHLPLGTDYLNGHKLACLAAEQEPAVVFPPFYFGQIYEARCFPGAVTLKPTLLLEVISAVLDEIGRNGFKKIILVNAHGGNRYLLPFLAQASLWQQKPYTIYYFRDQLSPEAQAQWENILESSRHGHACECETSISLANHPDLVHMDRVNTSAEPLNRLSTLQNGLSGIGWYANYPEHYAGDARTATAEKGRLLRQILVNSLVEFIKAVKADNIAPLLEQEFFEREARLRTADQK